MPQERIWYSRRLGELYHPKRTLWDERNELIITPKGIEILCAWKSVSLAERGAWSGAVGRATFGWVDAGAAAMLVFKPSPVLDWQDASFHPMRQSPEDRGYPKNDGIPISAIEALASTSSDAVSGRYIDVIGASDTVVKAAKPGDPPHVLVFMTLMEANTGIIVGLRATTWPPHFYEAVCSTIDRMLSDPYDPDAEERELARLMRFSSRELYQSMTVARCIGGQQ